MFLGNCWHLPKKCDDNNLCTVDSCDAKTGQCVHKPVVCNDENKCTNDWCDQKTGQCAYKDKPCDDKKICTSDTCDLSSGNCVFTPLNCDDGDKCTRDTCVDNCYSDDDNKNNWFKGSSKRTDKDYGCQHYSIKDCCKTVADCDDGNKCTADTCTNNRCEHKWIKGCCQNNSECSDKIACTDDTCDPTTNTCVFKPKVCANNDQNLCTREICEESWGKHSYFSLSEALCRCNTYFFLTFIFYFM